MVAVDSLADWSVRNQRLVFEAVSKRRNGDYTGSRSVWVDEPVDLLPGKMHIGHDDPFPRLERLPELSIAPGSLDERLRKQATISIVDCIMGVVTCRDQKFRIQNVIVLM